MKQSASIASIRALCGLGLPGEQLIPALLEALHRVIASSRNLFDWTDAEGNLIRYYFEGPIDSRVARHYFEEFHNKREAEAMPAFREAVTGRAVIRGAAELDNPRFYRSALYNEIWRPQRLHSRIEAIVRNARGAPLGSLVLYRDKGDPPFTAADESLLAAQLPYVARALEAASAVPGEFVSRRERRAFLHLAADGTLAHASEDAHKLLLLAHGGITPESASRRPEGADFPTLALLAEQIRRNEGASSRKVGIRVENAWGRFLFEAEPLLAVAASEAPLIHVCIQHGEPRPIAWRRALDGLNLTIAQKEVCALLKAGYTRPQIAAALSIAPSTVTDHVKKIYTKLDVHSVQDLCARLDEEMA
ncbi:MAG: LuxR C-terminal-related transcriptional regulator [Burkholderiales bacterium]